MNKDVSVPFLVVMALSTGCGSFEGAAASHERIATVDAALCSMDDFVHVEAYRNSQAAGLGTTFVQGREAAVGRQYASGATGCSGTLISDRLFLSAHHCLYAVGDTVVFNYQAEFGSDLEQPLRVGTTSSYPVVRVVDSWVQGNPSAYDVSVVELGPNALGQLPGATLPVTTMRAEDPNVGEWLSVIGHPSTHVTQLANGTTASGLKVVTQGPRTMYSDSSFPGGIASRQYIRAGESGSGLLNASGEVIGVIARGTCGATGEVAPSAAPVHLALSVWQSKGLTELTQLVLAPRPTPCLTQALPVSQLRSVGLLNGTFYARSSPGGIGAYGSSSCPYFWAVETTSVLDKQVAVISQIDSADVPTTKAACENTRLTSFAYGYRNGVWESVMRWRLRLYWDEGSCEGYNQTKPLSKAHGYSKFRVFARGESGDHDTVEGPNLLGVSAGVIVSCPGVPHGQPCPT